jgi:peptidoglycan/LPS O-acetylase OafA/YrhL
VSDVATPVGAGRNFRADINGLRAWAVLSVVLYHFGVAPFSGGFAGVDVFFVISGYLMCGIILGGIERGRFSVWNFYLARARRIWPALMVLCLAVLVFGWLFLMPEEYKLLGKHARESLVFSSNIQYFSEAGYFDVASKQKWLLHTWSLSVEWQFYLIFPLALMLLHRLGLRGAGMTLCLAVLLIASYLLAGWRTSINPDEAFYLLHTRAWEMLAGALVFRLQSRVQLAPGGQRLLEGVGLALILCAVLGFNSDDLWPGWLAGVPVLGAALMILAQRQDSLWTASRPMQWLGDASYSIYLWHWPVAVALAYFGLHQDPLWIALAIALSLLLGQLSYVLVETPSRRRLSRLSAGRTATLLILLAVVAAVAAQQVRRHGFPDRLPEEVARVEATHADKDPRARECLAVEDSCTNGEGPVRAIVMGDSHAHHLLAALRANIPSGEGSVLFRGVAACLVTFDARFHREGGERCDQLNDWLKANHRSLPQGVPLVLSGVYSRYTNRSEVDENAEALYYFDEKVRNYSQAYFEQLHERYLSTICELTSARPVYLVRPTPIFADDVPQVMGRALLLGRDMPDLSYSMQSYRQEHALILQWQDEAAERCGARILDPLPLLCDGESCPGARDGLPLYRDSNHLTERASRMLAPLFRQVTERPEETVSSEETGSSEAPAAP